MVGCRCLLLLLVRVLLLLLEGVRSTRGHELLTLGRLHASGGLVERWSGGSAGLSGWRESLLSLRLVHLRWRRLRTVRGSIVKVHLTHL